MADEKDVQKPFRFNPFKHHRNYILGILGSAGPEGIIGLLHQVCNNYIDIYTGIMSPGAIVNDVVHILKSKRVFQKTDFTHWVASQNGYQQIKLEDQSEWVIRIGNDNERYIHIHPTRTGPFTIRLKGSSLKTIYMLKTCFEDFPESLSLEKVNQIRMQIGLSPVKKLDRNKGILKCYASFFNNPTRNQT
ncbi:MAG TPA: hypothetical protein VFC67_17500 [Prolixibacteraceae bacterium]|nr:hypothetical protein [Prolixibacteraceae bacterium]